MASESNELKKRIEEWLAWDRNEDTCTAINNLVKDNNIAELQKILLNRLSFGTAGLRGKMGPGYGAMNDLVIIQTGQGVLKYLENSSKTLLNNNGVVIGYDGRHNSKRFAALTASIFLHAGYSVHLFSEVIPTPFIPFAVVQLKTAIGIMITASHNPKEDNGYKVYGPNGAQIISPVDKEIQKCILENLVPLDTSWDTDSLKHSKLLSDPLQNTLTSYLQTIQDAILPGHIQINRQTGLTFIYTAMHGVGYPYIKEVFDLANLKFVAVEEQKDPNPDFPTVKYPNPEEGKNSLDLAMKTAERYNSSIIVANDPDADRMAAAEKNVSTGEWKIFTGNEIGALLGWWLLHCFKLKHKEESLDNIYMLSSTVSSMILRSMASKEGFNFIETLTGFKWMGNKSFELINEGKRVIFAFEEAIGFMCGSNVLDKDGISAAVQLATLASYLYHENKTLSDKLQEIYNTYGYHVSCNSYFICHDQKKILKIFERIRNYEGPNKYFKCIGNGKYTVKTVRDLTTGYDNSKPNQKAVLPVSKSSQMITFNFDNGLVCTLRTSGTEPKIKYYTELCAAPGQTKEDVVMILNDMVTSIINEMLEPEINELVAQSK